MATGDIFESIKPKDFIPQNGFCQDVNRLRQVGWYAGFPLRRVTNDGFYTTFRTPVNGSPMTTGITVQIGTIEDPNNANVGLVYQLGVSGAKLTSGTTNLGTGAPTAAGSAPAGATAFGTEVTANITAPATQGIVTLTTFVIPKANLATPVAGDQVALLIRRTAAAADTATSGELIVVSITISDT